MRWVRLVTVAMLMVACSGREPVSGPVSSTAPVSPQRTGPYEEWVAVLAVGEPDDLEPLTRELMDKAPDRVATSPLACWEGIEADLGDQEMGPYAAALAASTRAELDAAVSRVGREPILVGSYPSSCGD